MKPFTLKPVKKFRKIRIKTCGNCKYLRSSEYGMTLKCIRPNRIAAGSTHPVWEHHAGNHAEDVYGDIWQHVCDRWTKKDE
jgi:hypothetical protein